MFTFSAKQSTQEPIQNLLDISLHTINNTLHEARTKNTRQYRCSNLSSVSILQILGTSSEFSTTKFYNDFFLNLKAFLKISF